MFTLLFFLLQDGDGRAACHFCQHAWCVIVPAGGFVSLCCCQQPQEAGMMGLYIQRSESYLTEHLLC